MKKLFLLFIIAAFAFKSIGQIILDDFGRIILNTYLPENIAVPAEAKALLVTKMNEITSNNGMGGSQVNPRFIISANVNLGTKDIIAGPPQLTAQNVEITLFVGDAYTNSIFSNVTLSLKGVGTNENKAFIDAFKRINPKNKALTEFLTEGKNKIIDYYNTQCDFIMNDAKSLVVQEQYNEAIYNLSIVPQICKDCQIKISHLISDIFQQKINAECKAILSKAKAAWVGQQNINSAENILNSLIEIKPNSICQDEVSLFIKEISNKLIADEKERLVLARKIYNDKIDIEKKRLDAYKEVALEQAKNQPKTINYNNINWE